MVKDQPRRLELRQFDLLKVTEVDVLQQFFKVQFFCLFAFPGGSKDEHLMKMDKTDDGKYAFGFGEDGKPNWLPSAGWFSDQFDTNNGIDWKFLDHDVLVSDDDILIKLRVEGSFYERLELWDFPYDEQDLTMSLAVNCRTTGNTPVELAVADDALLAVDMDTGFQLSQFYTIETQRAADGSELVNEVGQKLARVRVECTETGTSPDRMFPTMNISVKIIRRPTFYVFNVTVPMIIFNILAFLQFTIAPQFVPERLSISLTLVLTTAAYKFAVASLVPALSYMTMLDEYVLANWLNIVLIAIAGGLVGFIEAVLGYDDLESDDADLLDTDGAGRMLVARSRGGGGASQLAVGGGFGQTVDRIVCVLLLCFWLGLNVYFTRRTGMLAEAESRFFGFFRGGMGLFKKRKFTFKQQGGYSNWQREHQGTACPPASGNEAKSGKVWILPRIRMIVRWRTKLNIFMFV